MIKRNSMVNASIEVNEYIEKWSEVLPHLEVLIEWPIDEVEIKNDGCDECLVRKIVGFLENHGLNVYGF